MGLLEKLNRKAGVIVGDDVLRLFEYAQEQKFAVPAIVSITVVSALSSVSNLALERHLFLHRRCCSGGCPRPELPHRSAAVQRWRRFLRWQGMFRDALFYPWPQTGC